MTAGEPATAATAASAQRRRRVAEHLTSAARDVTQASATIHDCQLRALRLDLIDLGAELGQASQHLAAAERRLFKAHRQLTALPDPQPPSTATEHQ